MNTQLEVLHKIFELDLAPPFRLVQERYFTYMPEIHNRHSEKIGWFDVRDGELRITEKEISILNRVKQVFNLDNLTDDDVYHIAKHLVKWFQDKLPNEVKYIVICSRVKYPQ